jgi:hypothetical protein
MASLCPVCREQIPKDDYIKADFFFTFERRFVIRMDAYHPEMAAMPHQLW